MIAGGAASPVPTGSAALASVSEQSNGSLTISLGSVLQDMQSTTQALGADATLTEEIDSYLKVIRFEGGKEKPAVPMIKQLLYTAADRLDQHVTRTLDQPKPVSVVREWVDALLLQPIDYKRTEAPTEPTALQKAAEEVNATVQPVDSAAPQPERGGSDRDPSRGGDSTQELQKPTPVQKSSKPAQAVEETVAADSLSVAEKQRLKSAIDEFNLRSGFGDVSKARTAMASALQLLEGKNRPDLEAKCHSLLGRLYEKTGQLPQAAQAYQSAAQAFGNAQRPDRQASRLADVARVQEQSGQLREAISTLQTALRQLPPDAVAQTAPMLNDLGSLHHQTSNLASARQAYLDAAAVAQRPGGDKKLLVDIFSNLGAVYRENQAYPLAAKAYRASLQAAKDAGATDSYISTLQRFAGLYMDAGRPQQARQLLSLSQQLAMKQSS
jgi:hypothetical protein